VKDETMGRRNTGLSYERQHYYNAQGDETDPSKAAIVLFLRKDANSSNWTARLRVRHPLKDRYQTYPKLSLGTADLKEAVKNAVQLYENKRTDLRSGLEHSHRNSFKQLCKEWIKDQLHDLLQEINDPKNSFTKRQKKLMAYRIDRWEHIIAKYFENGPLANVSANEITTQLLRKWADWRGQIVDSDGRRTGKPVKSVVELQLRLIRRILKDAANRGKILKDSVPQLPSELLESKKKGKGQARNKPSRHPFTDREIRLMLAELPKWIETPSKDGAPYI
jgi:hypothetical protein